MPVHILMIYMQISFQLKNWYGFINFLLFSLSLLLIFVWSIVNLPTIFANESRFLCKSRHSWLFWQSSLNFLGFLTTSRFLSSLMGCNLQKSLNFLFLSCFSLSFKLLTYSFFPLAEVCVAYVHLEQDWLKSCQFVNHKVVWIWWYTESIICRFPVNVKLHLIDIPNHNCVQGGRDFSGLSRNFIALWHDSCLLLNCFWTSSASPFLMIAKTFSTYNNTVYIYYMYQNRRNHGFILHFEIQILIMYSGLLTWASKPPCLVDK